MFLRVFKIKTVAWILLAANVAGLGDARADGPVCDMSLAVGPLGVDNANLPDDLSRIFEQTEPGGCNAELSDDEQAFVVQLGIDQSQKVASLTQQYCPKGVCDDATLAQINRESLALAKAEVGAYHPGTEKQARVLAAIIASKQRIETLAMLRVVTANPVTAAAFADFAKKVSAASFQLQRANYDGGGLGAYPRQLGDAAATKWWAYLVPGVQIGAVENLAKYKAEQLIFGEKYGNPQVELGRAKTALTESMDKLSVAVRALPADQQATIRGAAEGLVGKFDQNLQASSDDFRGHNAGAILSAGALGSAAAIVAAVPTLIGAIGTAGSSSLMLTLEQSTLGGASTSAGGTGLYEVVKTYGHAVADALNQQTTLSCAMGKELAAHGSEILDNVFDNTLKGAAFGAVMGGGMAITLAHFQVLAAVMGTTRFAAAVYQNFGNVRRDYRALVRKCPALASLDNQAGVSPEALEEQARAKCNGETADAVASLVSDLVTAWQLGKGAHDVKTKTALIGSLLRKNREEGQGLSLVSNAQPASGNTGSNVPASEDSPGTAGAPGTAGTPSAVAPPPLSNAPVSMTVVAATTATNNTTTPIASAPVTSNAAPVNVTLATTNVSTTTAAPTMPVVPVVNSVPAANSASVNTTAPATNPLTAVATAPATATAPAPATAAPVNVGSGPAVALPALVNAAPPQPLASATPTLESILPAPHRPIDAGRTRIAAPTEFEVSKLTQLLHSEPHAAIGQVRDLRALYGQLRHRAKHESESSYRQKEAEFWRETSIRLRSLHQTDLEGWFQAAEAQARLDEAKALAH